MKASILLSLLMALGTTGTAQSVNAAIELYGYGKFQRAAEILTDLSRQNAKDPNLHIWLGKTCLKLRRWDEAIREFGKAVELDPKNGLPHLWLGRAYGNKAAHAFAFFAAGPARRTRQEFEAAAQLSPNDVDVRFDLLEFYAQAPGFIGGGQDKADAQAKEIAKLSPRLGYTARADIYGNQKDWVHARSELMEAVSKFPKDAGAYVDLAGFLLERGDFENAEVNARKALALDGSNREAQMLLAASRVSLRRNLADAVKVLQGLAAGPLTDSDPAFETVYYWLGQGYLAQGNKPEAREAFTASLGFDPEYSRSKDALARIKPCP